MNAAEQGASGVFFRNNAANLDHASARVSLDAPEHPVPFMSGAAMILAMEVLAFIDLDDDGFTIIVHAAELLGIVDDVLGGEVTVDYSMVGHAKLLDGNILRRILGPSV